MVNALYFNGHDARMQPVTLHPAPGLLEIHGEGLRRSEPFSGVRISSKLGRSPRLVYFSDGAHCEIADHAGFEALLRETGMKPYSMLARLEANWRHAAIATVLFLVMVFSLFQWGLPWAANVAAKKVPHNLALKIDTDFLKSLEKHTLRPSKVGRATQQRLADRLKEWKGLNGVSYTLVFRDSPRIGPNAFALPGGTVVVTDQLIALSGNDEEVLAVLAHELGHVSERHPLRQLLQGTVVGLAMTWYLGDISSLLASAPTLLLESSYSRDFERSADRYAVGMLRSNGIPPTRLADMLEKLEAAYHERRLKAKHVAAPKGGQKTGQQSEQPSGQQPEDKAGQGADQKDVQGVGKDAGQDAGKNAGQDAEKDDDDDEEEGLSGYFASHPATSERIREIRGAVK